MDGKDKDHRALYSWVTELEDSSKEGKKVMAN
jgi:hypothetical protein